MLFFLLTELMFCFKLKSDITIDQINKLFSFFHIFFPKLEKKSSR